MLPSFPEVPVDEYAPTLKHSSATAWLAQGSSLQMIQRMLRHADARSTER
jgi:site-specific recombinase XerD